MQNGKTPKKLEVSIVGGGLVGSLEALYLAKRGHHVHLYEYREDIRTSPQMRGRSINLALSHRGRRALRDVGLEEHVVSKHGIPMRARMIHRLDGSTYAIPYDARSQQCIYSVGRNYLNGLLLTESEKYPNVERHFNHKLTEVNLQKGAMTFLQTDTKQSLETSSDLIIGADGAYSAVRRAMMKQPLFDFSQQYIEHGYQELCIPPTDAGEFQMPENYLHIWPRGTFMMIALPNQDRSWTVTLFMPFAQFRALDSSVRLEQFFEKHFPDAVPLIGRKKLVDDFFGGKALPLVAIKCQPYHVSDKALLLGDAAHAVVPFYGQGMNAGFEDCSLLDELFAKHRDLGRVLQEFSDSRWRDAHAISDLAMYNYIEMRDLVTRPSYRMRKWLDEVLQSMLPTLWVPLYNSVTFTDIPYSRCIENRSWQDKVLTRVTILFLVLIVAGVFFALRGYF